MSGQGKIRHVCTAVKMPWKFKQIILKQSNLTPFKQFSTLRSKDSPRLAFCSCCDKEGYSLKNTRNSSEKSYTILVAEVGKRYERKRRFKHKYVPYTSRDTLPECPWSPLGRQQEQLLPRQWIAQLSEQNIARALSSPTTAFCENDTDSGLMKTRRACGDTDTEDQRSRCICFKACVSKVS